MFPDIQVDWSETKARSYHMMHFYETFSNWGKCLKAENGACLFFFFLSFFLFFFLFCLLNQQNSLYVLGYKQTPPPRNQLSLWQKGTPAPEVLLQFALLHIRRTSNKMPSFQIPSNYFHFSHRLSENKC